ncbi:MAG: T9SS type A sorting domain-containing protein [Bacteroidales bacterium]|nr:T9SS type A sorting domain-containing protein [Bacteroidales bacterium]
MRFKLLFISLFLVQITLGQEFISFESKKIVGSNLNTLPIRVIDSKKSNEIIVSYSFENAGIGRTSVKNTEYQFLHIEGFSKMSQVGAPALPAHNDLIALPGVKKPQIIILKADFQEIKGFNIHPTLEPERDTEGAPASIFEKDEKIYGKDEFFPKNIIEIENLHKYRGTPIAVTQIRPIQYNPVTKTIRVYTNIKYKIEYSTNTDSKSKLTNSKHSISMLKSNVLNASAINYTPADQKGSDSRPNYIIVTHNEYKAAADTLAKWKSQLGQNVEVVVNSVWTAETVKSAIQSRYQTYSPKPDYFLIIGDHTGNFAVPGEVHQDPQDGDDFATDLYYACMDGVGDYYPDMAHGRISVSSATEAMNVVLKIVNYERTPVTEASYYENGLNCAQFQDVADEEAPDGIAARRFCHTSENIRDYMVDEQGYAVERIYYTDEANTPTNFNNGYFSNNESVPSELLRANGYTWSGGATDILSSINAGKFYVFHRDHGYSGGIGWAHPRFISNNTYGATNNVAQLSNGNLLPVLFSINCHTGEFLLDNCFAEEFLRKENGGAVGVVGAAYYSYSGWNDGFSAGMIDAIWSNPGLTPTFGSGGVSSPVASSANNTRTMGDVVNQGLVRMIQIWGDSKYTHELFHWFGDPAMKIWTENPNNNLITATIPSSINCDATSLSISGCNVDDALVTLVVNGSLVAKENISGSVANLSFDYAGNSDSPALVTISKENHKPIIAYLTITGSCEFPPKAAFVSDKNNVYPGETVQFTDNSLNHPMSWAWTFEGGTPETSSDQNPSVVFSTVGSYTVSLKATNAQGTDSLGYENFITAADPTYCDATSAQCDEYISRVKLNTIDNTSMCNLYEDFTDVFTSLSVGQSHNIEITNSHNYDGDNIGCWIDWNQDKDFEDEDEKINIAYSSGTGTGNITVPGHANYGSTRMRVRLVYDEELQACGISEYGEVEDYMINVIGVGDSYEVIFNVKHNSENVVGAGVSMARYGTKITDDSGNAVFETVYSGNAINYSVQSSGYFTSSGTIDVVDGNLTENVILELGKYNVSFTIKDGSNPLGGASVSLSGYGTKVTDISGNVIFEDVYCGNGISYEVQSTDYITSSGTINVIDGDVTKNIFLEPIKYSVRFNVNDSSDPISGASVSLSGYGIKVTDNSGDALFTDVYRGNGISYETQSNGYITSSGTVDVVDEDITENVALELEKYKVNFTVNDGSSPISGADVTIGQDTKITDASGETVFDLEPTSYNFSVTASGFNQNNGSINVVDQDQDKIVTLSINTSIDGIEKEQIKIFPNPTSGIIKLEGEVLNKAKISVYDVSGKQLLIKLSKGNPIEIDLTSYSSGTYILKVEIDTKTYDQIIIRE